MNILIIALSVIVLIISYFLFKTAAGTLSLLKLNTVSYIFYFQVVIMALVGSVIVALGQADYHYMIKLVEDKFKIYAWLGILYSMLVMPISMIMLNKLVNANAIRKLFFKYINEPVYVRSGNKKTNLILLIVLLYSISITAYVLFSNDFIPLFTLIKGDLAEAARQRVFVRRNFGGIDIIKGLFGSTLLPILAYYTFVVWYSRKGIYKFFVFVSVTLITFLYLSYDTQKAPIVFFLAGYIIVLTLVKGGISKKTFFAFFIAGLSLIIGGYILTGFSGLNQLTDIKSAFYGRLFVSSIGGYILSLKFFPDIITEPTWQIGIPQGILRAFDLPIEESARLLMKSVNPAGVESGTANLISSYYMGEAYANYGIVGFFISPIIVGFVVQFVHLFVLSMRKDPLYIALYAFITIKWLLNAGFVSFLYLKIIFFPIVLVFLFKFIIRLIPTKKGLL